MIRFVATATVVGPRLRCDCRHVPATGLIAAAGKIPVAMKPQQFSAAKFPKGHSAAEVTGNRFQGFGFSA